MIPRTTRLRAAVGAVTSLLVVAGCGGGTEAPVDQQPRLAVMLTDVDDAITSGRYLQAGQGLNALVSATTAARGTGGLDSASADRVLAAAAKLRTQLITSIEERRAAAAEPPTSGDEGDQDDGGPGADGQGHEGHGHGKPDKPKPDKPKPDKPKPR
jgi:hypothetical protein